MSFTAKGLAGSVRCGPYVAAELGAWSFDGAPDGGGTVTATVVRLHGYWGTQPATELRLGVGRGQWRWRLAGVDAGAGVYRVSGPPERS